VALPAVNALAFILIGVFGFVTGFLVLLGYILWRMMRNEGWDDSNITNALRLLSHVTLHAQDFGLLQYPDGKKPFWYVNQDELSQVVDSRPNK
jgi:hypothetical protein